MTTQTEALKLALEALEDIRDDCSGCEFEWNNDYPLQAKAHAAIKEALNRGAMDSSPNGEAQTEQNSKCNPHPKAPHGFDRNASHANDRYICECEGWDAYDAGYEAGVIAGIETSMEQEPEQEPVAWRFTGIAGLKRYMTQKQYDAQTPETKKWYEPFKCVNCTTPPQRTWVGLTDEERWDCLEASRRNADCRDALVKAIEAKLRELNEHHSAWVGLTDDEVMEIAFNFDVPSLVVRTVDGRLKEKNG